MHYPSIGWSNSKSLLHESRSYGRKYSGPTAILELVDLNKLDATFYDEIVHEENKNRATKRTKFEAVKATNLAASTPSQVVLSLIRILSLLIPASS